MLITLSLNPKFWPTDLAERERRECLLYCVQHIRGSVSLSPSPLVLINDSDTMFANVHAEYGEIASGSTLRALEILRRAWVRWHADRQFFGVSGVCQVRGI